MGKTGRKIFLCGDYVDSYFCNQCEEEDIGTYQHWKEKDFTLCANCLEKSYKELFEPYQSITSTKIRKKVTIPSTIKKSMFERDFYKCRYCGYHKDLTADHVIPESRGGETSLENLVTACGNCNSKKGARLPEEAGMKLLEISEKVR